MSPIRGAPVPSLSTVYRLYSGIDFLCDDSHVTHLVVEITSGITAAPP